MDLKNKRVLVAGTGISGIGAVGLLMHTDADLILYDGNEKLSVAEIQSKLSGEKDIMRTEIAVYQMLQDTGVPLPKIYALCTDRTLVPCDYIICKNCRELPGRVFSLIFQRRRQSGFSLSWGR